MLMKLEQCLHDWDFTEQGRIRQAERMFALTRLANGNCVVDFICPYDDFRSDYNITVWMNTIKEAKHMKIQINYFKNLLQ